MGGRVILCTYVHVSFQHSEHEEQNETHLVDWIWHVRVFILFRRARENKISLTWMASLG